jgi:hypothetical protein
MEADLQAHVAFFLTGKRSGDRLDAVDGLDLRPALFTGYRDLTKLRYDFPIVLVRDRDAFVQSLSELVDGILNQVAKGDDGERIRKHVLRLEQEIRKLVSGGARGLLSSLWTEAAGPLASADKLVADSLARARSGLKIDGEVMDCDEAMPARLVNHAWNMAQQKKAQKFGADITRLILRLSDILKAEFVNSDAGRSAGNLRASVGGDHAGAFDFEAMSRILTRSIPEAALPKSRRQRLETLLSVLQSQRFFQTSEDGRAHAATARPYAFAFESCSSALKAYRERLPKAIELARTIAIAQLEVNGEYSDSRHDPIFDAFGENGLDPKDLALFPDYLVCVSADKTQATENEKLTEILSAGLPMKILVQTDDILEESPVGNGRLAFGIRSRQLASVSMGFNDVFVLQSSSSNLVQLRDRLRRGLDYPGSTLFSVFSGSTGKAGGLPLYLTAAAAMESRAFPAFTYDPSAGPDWASRFSLSGNPQPDIDWPLQDFAYEDQEHQRVAEDVAFTLVDFVACDPRYARHFARVPRANWNGTMIPVGESLARETSGLPDKVPCLMMVDRNDILQKVIVDDKLIREARRCREMWRSLQELGGINNSHARNLLAREKKIWEERMQREAEAPAPGATSAAPAAPIAAAPAPAAPIAAAPTAPAPAAAEPEAERSRDEAYIETPRCSTCNECTTINNKMFAYDGNQQAIIADINAGTYAQLVEAAENCQVSIIHPGKPRNPNEPGLEELLKRAEAFL